MADARVRIIKSKLMQLYDGNVDMAKSISIDEIIDNITLRINQHLSKRGNSV